MPRRSLVVIGASAGSLEPLGAILSGVPPTLEAAIVIVVHTRSDGGRLPQILARRSGLPVETATDGAPIAPGRIYVAPPDRHVLVTTGGLRVVRGPRENGFRPAIDPLFRTAARAYGAQVVGIVLSGALDDGSYGLSAIAGQGGVAIVQDPDEAEVPHMPLAAIRETTVDAVLPAVQIGPAIARFCAEPVADVLVPLPGRDQLEPQRAGAETQVADMERLLGAPSPITCPACGGALWETEENGVVRYACHVGHQYAPDSLLVDHTQTVEQALWSAVRVLEQHAELRVRMSARAKAAGMGVVAESFAKDGKQYHRQAKEIRRLVFGDTSAAAPAAEAPRRRAGAR